MAFLNIFSKKPLERPPELKIIVDNREKSSLVLPELLSKNFKIEFRQLPVADYIINDIAIERKTLSDLKSYIINKRIIKQPLELKQYKKTYPSSRASKIKKCTPRL
jgi:ERCC4-type nuclease